jgi:hypothetical protein
LPFVQQDLALPLASRQVVLRRRSGPSNTTREPARVQPAQYVCRQLCVKVSCLELQLNCVVFHGLQRMPGVDPPALQFSKFLSESTTTKTSWLRHVTLELRSGYKRMEETIPKLSEFLPVAKSCRDNPNAQVGYVIKDFRSSRPEGSFGFFSTAETLNFLLKGICLNLLFCGVDLRRFVPNRVHNFLACFCPNAKVDEYRMFNAINVPNQRIWPGETTLANGFA